MPLTTNDMQTLVDWAQQPPQGLYRHEIAGVMSWQDGDLFDSGLRGTMVAQTTVLPYMGPATLLTGDLNRPGTSLPFHVTIIVGDIVVVTVYHDNHDVYSGIVNGDDIDAAAAGANLTLRFRIGRYTYTLVLTMAQIFNFRAFETDIDHILVKIPPSPPPPTPGGKPDPRETAVGRKAVA